MPICVFMTYMMCVQAYLCIIVCMRVIVIVYSKLVISYMLYFSLHLSNPGTEAPKS